MDTILRVLLEAFEPVAEPPGHSSDRPDST